MRAILFLMAALSITVSSYGLGQPATAKNPVPRAKPTGSTRPYTLNATTVRLLNPGEETAASAAGPTAMGVVAQALKGNIATGRVLSDFDVELIVDCSASMQKTDCTGYVSRWNWCGKQAQNLGKELAAYSPNGLTVTTFNSNYEIHPNVTAQQITYMFQHPTFKTGTKLAEPLADRLLSFFRAHNDSSKPLLIAVITDGVPYPAEQPTMVAKALIAASKQMESPHQVTVVFFQIGSNDNFGKEYLRHLDDDLVQYGAKYDLVRTVPYRHLQRVGLAQALVDSIKEFHFQNGAFPVQ